MTETKLANARPDAASAFRCWLKWTTSVSEALLTSSEGKILSFLKTAYNGFYVNIGSVVGPIDKIWTISLNTESVKIPIVLVHGMASGVGFWALNLDAIAEHRPVYAFDLLGFARSSRSRFDRDGQIAEKQMISSIEEWRKKMNINQMILLGHSLGGYLATSYTIAYPDRVKHLILADPWGFREKPKDVVFPLWVRGVLLLFKSIAPLWTIRAAGPYGQWLVEKSRPDILRKFNAVIPPDDKSTVNPIAQYIYQCNAQTPPTGELLFDALRTDTVFPKYPMLNRIHELKDTIPITLLYGEDSWMDKSAWKLLQEARKSYINIKGIGQCGHHVYADQPNIFNNLVNDACFYCDSDTTQS